MAETVFALATAPGTAAIAIIRLGGPAATAALERLTQRPAPAPRQAVLRRLLAVDGTTLDEALVLRFIAPHSYTGDDLIELHCHGGRAVVAAVLRRLAEDPALTPAAPGAFTQRAFQNGRLDLTQVEGLGDLLAAESEGQRRLALGGLSGRLRRRAEDWRARLIHALAMVEATIDWADEEVPEDVSPAVGTEIIQLSQELKDILATRDAAERLRTGLEVVLLGAPNAGKSTLLNALAGRDLAIEADRPGTTRDLIECPMEIDGLPVTLIDTAGLNPTPDEIEAMGIERAANRARDADLRLFLHAPDAPLPPSAAGCRQPQDLDVATKADLGALPGIDISVSARREADIDRLRGLLAGRLADRIAGAGLISHVRQEQCVAAAATHLAAAGRAIDSAGAEIVAEELRGAVRALERLTGRIGAEDVLDSVFSAFCLGK
ncbi:MAG: tRNA uridine-5-carboxymethylaminomethyl(34) synthesis GTPase MnmE [Pseudomonadota bacterium]